MKRYLNAHSLAAVAALVAIAAGLSAAVLLGIPHAHATDLLFAMPAAAVAAPAQFPWRRIREDLPDFVNVTTTGRATCAIPQYGLTLLRATLKLGGTSLTKAMLTEIRMRLGSDVVWFATGPDLDKINTYKGLYQDANFLVVDFTDPYNKEHGGEFVGGYDMQAIAATGKQLYLEVTITGATAPTLSAKATWGVPQGNKKVLKLKQTTYPSGSATGRLKIPFEPGNALVRRVFAIYAAGADICGITATSVATTGNGGNGVMGAITVSAGAQVGDHKLIITDPGANVGAFVVIAPDGSVSGRGDVATAYSSAGLAFTLADGATDFKAGDSFTITVPGSSDGNVSRMEIKKDSRVVWDMKCSDARYLEKQYGRKPQTRLYVADLVADNHQDGILNAADATLLELYATLGAADTLTIYQEVLQDIDVSA